MAFVVQLPTHLDRAVTIMAAQKDISKAKLIEIAVQEYALNHIVAAGSEDESSDRV